MHRQTEGGAEKSFLQGQTSAGVQGEKGRSGPRERELREPNSRQVREWEPGYARTKKLGKTGPAPNKEPATGLGKKVQTRWRKNRIEPC